MRRATIVVGDLSATPEHNFGSASLGWWCAVGVLLIGGMGVALAIGVYFFLLPIAHGQPSAAPLPPLGPATAFVALAILSELGNAWMKRVARARAATAVRWGLVAMSGLGIALLVLRGFEFAAMTVRWDQNAYGSVVWALLLLHTMYLACAVFGGIVPAVLTWTRRVDDRRFGNVSDNVMYWHFIVWSGALVYLVLYWTPRWL